jgi:hypothetical protein
MTNLTLGEIIAERHFEARDETGVEYDLVLHIGKPIPDANEGGDWCCPYQITGFNDNKVSAAFGVDSIQALLLSLQKAALELNHYQKVKNSNLTWLDQDDLGLPKS